jgi:hypothetical protein
MHLDTSRDYTPSIQLRRKAVLPHFRNSNILASVTNREDYSVYIVSAVVQDLAIISQSDSTGRNDPDYSLSILDKNFPR